MMNKLSIRFLNTDKEPADLIVPGKLLINKTREKALREKSSLLITEALIKATDITVLADNNGEMLYIIDFLDKQLPGRFYFNLFTPFENDYMPLNFNEEFDFLSTYKKSIVYDILYFILFYGSKKVKRNEFYSILDSIVDLHNVSDVWGILDQLCHNKAMKEHFAFSRERIDLLKMTFSRRITLYDLLEDSFSNARSYPFLMFSIKSGFETSLFTQALISSLNALLKRRWLNKSLRMNIVLSVDDPGLLTDIMESDVYNNHENILFFIINPDIDIPGEADAALIRDREGGGVLFEADGEIHELMIEAPSYYSGPKYEEGKIADYFKKKKKIKKSSSFVIYRNETGKKRKIKAVRNQQYSDAGQIQVYYLKPYEHLFAQTLYPYLGAEINCEYKKNPANIIISKKMNLMFTYNLAPDSLRIEYFDAYKKTNLSESIGPKISLMPINMDLNNAEVIHRIKSEIKAFVTEKESLNLFYNRYFKIFSEYQQSYGDFIDSIKKLTLKKYDQDLWELKEKHMEKWNQIRDKIFQDYPDISIKDMLENHYVRLFLFSKEMDYPENLSLSSPGSDKLNDKRIKYAFRRFEEELLEKLIIIKDRMDRIVEDTVSYPVRPDINDIIIEELSIIYLPFDNQVESK